MGPGTTGPTGVNVAMLSETTLDVTDAFSKMENVLVRKRAKLLEAETDPKATNVIAPELTVKELLLILAEGIIVSNGAETPNDRPLGKLVTVI